MPENMHRIPFRWTLRREIERLDELAKAEGGRYGIRTLARRLAEDWPEGATLATIENERRALRKYLYRGVVPVDAKKRRIAVALGRGEDFFFEADPGLTDLLLERARERGQKATA